jgi:hypothetical protein
VKSTALSSASACARVALVESQLEGHTEGRARSIAMGAATTLAIAVSAAIGLKVVVGA